MIILPQTDHDEASRVVERVDKNILEYNNGLDKKNNLELSISIGVAVALKGDNLIETMRLADKDMYRNKEYKKRRK